MSVHYKFKSSLTYDTITFDGLHISVKDLKKAILQQKQIGKTTDFDLQITNAQTNEVYLDETTLIPKNSSLIIVRIPLTAQQKRAWERAEASHQLPGTSKSGLIYDGQDPGAQKLAKAIDLSKLDASEDDKIIAMMTQSTLDYDPSNYMRIRGSNQVGEVPSHYRCFKCHQPGHWIKDCRLNATQETSVEIRKSTGIPRSFMVPVEGPSVPGAMMTPTGQFAVPQIDHQAYQEGKKPAQEEMAEKPPIPEDLLCSVCQDLLTDAVMIPCCGNSFCDDCIRMVLLESETHQCPDCKECSVSPDTLIPNRFLRTAVNTFRNQTGYRRAAPPVLSRAPQQHETPSQHHPQQYTHPPPVAQQPMPDLSRQPPPIQLGGPPPLERDPLATTQALTTISVISPTDPPSHPPPPGNSHSSGLPIHAIDSTTHSHLPMSSHSHSLPPMSFSRPPPNIGMSDRSDAGRMQKPPPPKSFSMPRTNAIVDHAPPGVEEAPLQPGSASSDGHAKQPPRILQQQHRGSLEERSGTPTVDEQSAAGISLPDTSLPPPQPAYQIPSFPLPNRQTAYGQGYGGPMGLPPHSSGFPPRMLHPSYGSGVPPHGQGYNIDSSRGGMRTFRGFPRGRPRGMHPGFRGPPNGNQIPIIDDPLAAFERMLMEKEKRDRQLHRARARSISRSRSKSPVRARRRSRSRSFRTPTRSKTRSRSRSLSRTRTQSPAPRARTPPPRSRSLTRSRSRSRTPRSRSRSLSHPPSRVRRSRTRSPPARVRTSRTRSRSRTPSRTRSRSRSARARSKTPPPTVIKKKIKARSRSKSNSYSLSLSRSRSRSLSRSISPRDRDRLRDREREMDRERDRDRDKDRDRKYSPHRTGSSRYRSPPSRTPPPRFVPRYNKEHEIAVPYHESEFRYYRGRGRGRYQSVVRKALGRVGPGAPSSDSSYYNVEGYTSSRYQDGRYDNSHSSRSYHHQAPVNNRPTDILGQQPRYNQRRYDQYEQGAIAPPGTAEISGVTSYRPGYQEEYLAPPGVTEHRVVRERDVSFQSGGGSSSRDNVRELAARDWERTRDREIEQRERERIREYEDRYTYQSSSSKHHTSMSPSRDRHHRKTRESGKENKPHPVEALEVSHRGMDYDAKEDRNRVLIDLKKEPSIEKEKRKEREVDSSPMKEKKRDKEKKKKKKDSDVEKKKKRKKEKKEGAAKVKAEDSKEGKPNVDAKTVAPINPGLVKMEPPDSQLDPLYGDLEGTRIDQSVVESYGRVPEGEPLTSGIGANNAVITEVPIDGEVATAVDQLLLQPVVEQQCPPDAGQQQPPQQQQQQQQPEPVKENVMLAPVPELSKWELDEDLQSTEEKSGAESGSTIGDKKMVTSEVLKRAENVIFQKAVNAIRPFDVKRGQQTEKPEKPPKEKKDVPQIVAETTNAVTGFDNSREARKTGNSIQVTIPSTTPQKVERSVEVAPAIIESEVNISKPRLDRSKFGGASANPVSPVRVSAKERLGAKVDDVRRSVEESKRIRSAVERKSKSRSPRKFMERKGQESGGTRERHKEREKSPSRERVVVVGSLWGNRERRVYEEHHKERKHRERERDRERRQEETVERGHGRRARRERKHSEKSGTRKVEEKVKADEKKSVSSSVSQKKEESERKMRKNPRLASDKRKPPLDEAAFEPDYDESSSPESEPEVPGEEKNLLINLATGKSASPAAKKRSRSPSNDKPDKKKLKQDANATVNIPETTKENEKVSKKVEGSDTADSSDTESSSDTSSESSIEVRKKHRKKKRSKKKKKKNRKKRKQSSSESESTESSSSDSEVEKAKKSKKHKHKAKKSKSAKKKKKSKHK